MEPVALIDLRKQTVIDIAKNSNLNAHRASVVFVCDFSGSMDSLYRKGSVQRLVERILPIGIAFDDNQNVDFFIFSDNCRELESLTRQNYMGYVDRKVINRYQMSGTNYSPVVRDLLIKFFNVDPLPMVKNEKTSVSGFFKSFFGSKSKAPEQETPVVNIILKPIVNPVFVIFITDGDTNTEDRSTTENFLRTSSNYGIFFHFIGIGSSRFSFLDGLDNLSGRLLDNASFSKINDLEKLTDAQLYQDMMKEYPSWVVEAKRLNLIQ